MQAYTPHSFHPVSPSSKNIKSLLLLATFLWGDNYFNPKTEEWARHGWGNGSNVLFNMFVLVLDPIYKTFD